MKTPTIQPESLSQRFNACLRRHRTVVGLVNFVAITSYSTLGYADVLYRTNSGALSVLDTTNTTLAAPAGVIQNYAEGTAFTAADVIAFNNLITAGTTFRVSNTTATNLQVAGLQIGTAFNGTVLNPGGAITIQNASNAAGGAAIANTITLGASGIDMSLASQNLTISTDATVAANSMTLALGAAQNWLVNAGRTLTINSPVTGTATPIAIGTGLAGYGGTVVLGGANTYTGAMSATGTALTIDVATAANRLDATAGLTLNRSTLLTQGAGTFTQVVNGLTLGTGANQLTFGGTTANLNVGAIARSGFDSLLNVGTASRATTSTANVNGILGGWAVLNKTDWAVGGGSITALVAGSYTAKAAGAYGAAAGATANVRIDGTVTAVPNETINSLKFASGAFNLTQTAATTLNITSGGILKNDNNTTTISGGTITAGGAVDGAADTLYVWQNANTMAVSSAIANNGTDVVNLVKAGDGSLRLDSNSNSFSGKVTITGGRILVGNANAAGVLSGSDIVFALSPGSAAGTAANDGMLVINRTDAVALTQNISGVGGDSVDRNAIRKSAGTTLTLTPTTANTYFGGTRVEAGSIVAGNTTALSPNSIFQLNNTAGVALNINDFSNTIRGLITGGATGGNVTLGSNSATTLTLAPLVTDALSYAGVISGSGNLIKNGAGAQTLSAVQTYAGSTTVNAGTLTVLGLADTSVVSLVNTGTTLNFTGSDTIGGLDLGLDTRISLAANNLTVADSTGVAKTLAGVITGSGGLTFTGATGYTLTGGQGYTGATTITANTVTIGTANAVQVINDRSAVSIGATGVLDLNGNSETIGSLAGVAGASILMGAGTLTVGLNNTSSDFAGTTSAGAGGLTKLGTGTQTLSGVNSFTGAVNIGNVGGQTGGGLTIGTGGSLADTVNVRVTGSGTSFGVNASDTVGAVTGTRNTTLALGTGATLTSSYTDGTPAALAAAADSALANGRIIRNINTAGLKPGDLISGTGAAASSYVVQIIDNDTVLVNQNVPTGPSVDFAPTVTSVSVLDSALNGLGGFTKNGTGSLILTGNSTHSGATTINAGIVQIGGIWNGQKFSIHDTLSDSSSLVFGSTGTQTLNFANSSTNLTPFERIGSLAGGVTTGTSTTINLTSGSSVAVLAFGGDNTSTTYSGNFLPGSSSGTLIKEGTGTFTWANPTDNTYDGIFEIRGGGLTSANQGLDAATVVRMQNSPGSLATTFTNGVTDTLSFLEGGAGVTRTQPSTGFVGALYGNYLSGVAPSAVINTGTVMTLNSATTGAGFNGVISGAGGLTKAGAGTMILNGINTYTGETRVDTGILRTGVLSRSAGVGAIAGSDLIGALSATSGLRLTGGTLDINGTAQTALRINATSTSGAIQLVNGSLTLSDQNTQTTGTAITGNRNSVLNLNATAASTLTLTGAGSSLFAGTVNVGTNAAMTLNTGVNFGDLARINLNGTGTQLTLAVGDNIGSVAGTGNIVLTGALGLLQAESGTSSSTAFSGATSGVGALNLSSFGGLTVSGNMAHSGGIGLSNGSTLVLNYGAGNNIFPATGALSLNGGNLTVISSSATPTILESVASTNLNAGASSVAALTTFTAVSATGQGPGQGGINLGAITRAAGGTLNVAASSTATSSTNVNGILGGTNTAYATFDGSTWAVANGAGTAITGLATYNADTFTAAQHTDITVAGTNAGGTAATLRFSGANASDITGTTTLSMGGILVTSNVRANTTTISGALSATGNELIIHQYNPFGELVLSNVAGTNTAITTAGGGKTLITNSPVSTGITTVGYGYLQLGDNTVGGSVSGMVGSGTIRNDGTLGVNRNNAVTFGGIISGAGNFEQRGSGTTTLSAANTYLGRTTVLGGTLEVTNNAGLGGDNFGLPNRWANLTSVNTGGSLLLNVAGGGAITETLNLDGGTLDLRSTVATTLSRPIILSSDSTIRVSNPGAAVSHTISGEIYALPGSDLAFTGVGGATPSTLILAPAATTGSRWENTSVGAGAIVQVGTLAGSRGFIGTGNVSIAGTLAFSTNDNYVITNNITGAGTLALNRNANYLTGDLSGFSGALLITPAAGQNVNVSGELGNDTYGTSFGTGPITVTASAFAGTSGIASVRTHFNQDITMSNTINLNPATDGAATPNSKNAQFIRAGIGNVTLDGTINLGSTVAVNGSTQRNLIQSEGGGKLLLNATLAGGSASNLLNVVNNGIIVVGGSASNTYNGILSGNNVWVFNNAGTTTLSGANTFDSGNNYFRQGTINLTGGTALPDNTDIHVLGATILNVNASETIGQVHSQRGATINIASGQTLTIDDNASQLIAGAITGAGNLSIGASTDNQTAYVAMYGTNTATGNLIIGGTGGTTGRFGAIQTTNLTNAIGSFATVTLGTSNGSGGVIDYVGSGQTYAGNIALAGTGTNSITANGNGGLIISGNLTSSGVTSTLGLRGQSGGYFNPIINRVDGAITESTGTLSILMGNSGDDDRFGITGRWTLTNANNDFSGAVTVNVGMLELAGNLGDGSEATSVLGDTNTARTFTLGSNNFNGRRYDMFGSGDQQNDAGFSQGTNTLIPAGAVGTMIFNDPNVGTANLNNITWAMPNVTAANTSGMQFINNGVKQVNLFNAFTFGTTGNRVVVLDGSNTLSNTINGAIANPTSTQSTRIDKEGSGTWRLAGTNTYTGATTINNGILELVGGAAIADANTVAISADGGDGFYSGTAMLRIIGSETFANLTGDIGTEVQILSGQTLTLRNGANNPYNGVISNSGRLTTETTGGTGFTVTLPNKNTYTGITTLGSTGTATANNGITITHLANGGIASGIGAGSSAATDLVFTTTTAGTNGGILGWAGFNNQSTDRLFTMGLGTAGARINANGTLVGTDAPAMTFSNMGAIAFTGSGTRTLTLGGATVSDNTFRPQITDGGGATTLSKVEGGLWLINPDVAGNTYTGGTSITGGTLAIQAANALGTGTITINGGAVGLEIRGTGITLANNITNVVDNGGLTVSSGSNVATGTNTLTAGNLRLAVLSGASLELNHATTALTGIGGLWKFGQGNLIISGTNAQTTTTGVAILSGGLTRLEYGTNNTSKLNDAAALTLGWNGAGGVTIPGNNPVVAGQTYIMHQSGATLDLSNGSHAEQVLSTTFSTGANSITRSAGAATINLENITRANTVGSTVDFGTASIATTNNLNGVGAILSTTGGGAGTATGAFATVAKTGWATTAGTGTDIAITALAAAGYNNALTIETFGAGFNTDIISAAAASAAATTNTVRFNANQASTLTLSGLLQLQSSGLLVTPTVGAFDTIITGSLIQNAAATVSLEALIVHQHNTAGALQIDSVIQNNTAAQGLTKSGAGKLFLGGLNTFTGAINLNEGEIQVGGTAAIPGTATNAYLSGVLATPAANANAGINLSEGATLRFRTTNTTVYNSGVVAGSGAIIMDTGNLMPLLLDDDNGNYHGNITVNQGTLQVANQPNALGSSRGITTIGALGTLQLNTAVNSGEFITYLEGANVTALAVGGATLSGKQTLSNTTTAGLNFNIAAPTTAGTVGINVSGIMYGTAGFTKSGNGILQISANNFDDVYDGFTGINDNPTLSGQILINAGVLNVGGARALGAHGAGNEVIVASSASLDLRGQALNYGDDSDLTRKFLEISGTGATNAQGNLTGALRNSTGTGQTAFLKLNADSVINSGGTVNASALIIGTFDSNLSNANALTGAFTRNASVIDGGTRNLTIQGGRNGSDNFIIADPTFSSALGSLIIREGGTRLRHEVSANIGGAAGIGITAANITGGIEIGYAGVTAADLTGATAAYTGSFLGAHVGARFQFDNWFGTAHTVDISMNGPLAAAATGTPGGAFSLAGGQNYLTADFFTIPDGTTYLNGGLALTGAAMRNIIQNDSVGNYTVQEQGNLVVAPATKLVFGGVASGTGGFTKNGQGDVRFTANNTLQGDVNVLRLGSSSSPWETHTYKINGVDYATNGLGEGWAEWSLTLNGANGAFSDAANINLQRRGMLTLDNTTRLNATSGVVGANNNNRIADDAVINMDQGWFRINGGTVANTEILGTVNNITGTNIIDLYGTDGAGVATDLTITTLNRTAGSTLRITNLDATSTFSTAVVGDSARVSVGTLGTGAALSGGSGAANTSTMSIAQGVFGGNAPIDLTTDLRVLGFNNGNVSDLWNQQRNIQFATGSHFMTMESGFLRPLDNDEYFTAPTGVINATSLGNINQNVNLSDVNTIMSQDSTINALRLGALADNDGTGATSLIDHHAINLFVDGTLKINSGMISSAYWTVGNTANAGTFIIGGALDFNGKEAIINNQNAFYNLTSGTITGGGFEIRSAITNAAGLTKTGFSQVVLDAANTYSGVTTVTEGVLFLRHGRSALGLGGAGNGQIIGGREYGVVINGSGGLNSGNGVTVGTPGAREDIYIGILAASNQIARNDNDVTVWNSNIVLDNVDLAGHPIFTPVIRTDNSATSIFNGNITGGNTAVINDVLGADPRRLSFASAGNNVFIFRGQFGDHFDVATGNAIPIADQISLLPTLAGTRTNENEVLRVDLGGSSLETNYILDRQYNAAGRLTLEQGTLIVNYDPTSGDGTGFWTNTAISKIPNADSTTTAFNINGGTVFQGFQLGTTSGTAVNNGVTGLFLSRPGQVFNMASWSTVGTGAKYIGGINETGTVTFGNGTGSLTAAGTLVNLQAFDGGTVVFNQRITGNSGTAPSNFGFLKQGRGNVVLQNISLASAGDSNFVLAGGTLTLNHSGTTVQALVGNQNARFDGGTLISLASTGANTTASLATNDAADRVLNFSIGGTEIVARGNTGGRTMTVNMGNANANNTTTNFTRGLGATANLVEDSTSISGAGAAQITLQFNASTTAAVKNQVIPWATYGTLSRTATDFAMSDVGASNDVRAYGRALDEFNNNVATWAANQDVSENGGSGFSGSLASPLTLSTLRFDANADSTINLGTNVLTVAGSGLASSGGGILISSNVGSSNKTITGSGAAALTTSGGRVELIMHHYGTGNLNINVPITGSGVDLVIAGPSTTNAATIGTTGAVVLGSTNTYDGQTFINGSVLSISNVNQLGTNATASAIAMNGGTLRFTGTGLQSLGTKGIEFQGNGGTLDITDGAGDLYLDTAITSNAQYRGDLIKVGAGTVTLNGTSAAFGSAGNPGFLGLIDVRQGTLRLAVDHGNNTAGNETSEFTTAMGSSISYADGTVFRSGTNFAIQMGNANNAGGYSIGEWLTFQGNNYVSVGTINSGVDNNTADAAGGTEVSAPVPNPNNRRPINLNGVNTINGTTTFDVIASQTLRLNNGGVGYTTGNGTIIKDGQGTMQFQSNSPDFTGAITILQGRLTGVGQADPLGTGYTVANGSKVITLGSDSRQGIAELALTSDSIQGATHELNHNLNVVYNPAQAKRLLLETFVNGSQIELNGDITLNDNLNIMINDAAETGGSQNYVNLNGKLRDGVTTSGNIIFSSDDTGNANDNTNGRVYNYLVLKNDNSTFTGDVRVSIHTSYDQDETAILRLEHAAALGSANDVDMGFNSILQAGGGARTIGSLATNGGIGPFIGGNAGGTMGASANGTSVVIENAAATSGTLTITQTTPVQTEVQWNAHFRDGTLNSEFLAPGAGPVASAALNIVKAGNGWATITTDNAYTGTTTVTGGTLQVGRNGVGDTGATTAAGFTSNAGTTVAGTGAMQGITLINGNLNPGDEAGTTMGTLTVNGAATLGATSLTSLQAQRASYTALNAVGYNDSNYATWIGGLTTDSTYSHLLNDPVTTAQHDKITITGGLTFTSGGKITLVNNGYSPTAGDVFNLLDWTGAMSGTINVGGTALNGGLFRTGAETGFDLNLFELGSGFRWDVSLFNSAGVLVVVVPEPSRALLMLLGLMALFFRRRRQD